jgi:hypothetical protein
MRSLRLLKKITVFFLGVSLKVPYFLSNKMKKGKQELNISDFYNIFVSRNSFYK